ncbi:MAG: pilus assembly protein TadG-related protein [Thiohalocapsa sp.]
MSRTLQASAWLPRFAKRLAADRRGVSAIITAIALTTLAGFCGLAIDVVMWEVNQRTIQGVVDQAALAAATAYRNAGETGAMGDSATAQNAAYATAIRNGYTASQITVAAYNDNGTCTNDGCLKVMITQPQPQYFTRVFFDGGVAASAHAVGTCSGCGAGSYSSHSNGGNPCVMALNPTGSGVISDTGGAVLSLNACDLYNNSTDTSATQLSNNASVQGCSATDACGSRAFLAQPNNPGNFDVPVVTGAAPAPDPYGNLTAPTVASSCLKKTDLTAYYDSTTSTYNNLPSGTYCATFFQNLSQTTVNFANDAVIVISGGLSINNNNTINGTHVFLYVNSSGSSSEASNVNAATTLNISAPITGPYAGLALWFGGTSGVSYSGQNGSGFSGAIYAPQVNVNYAGGNTSSSTCTRLIANSITLSGGATETFNNSGCPTFGGSVTAASGVTGSTTYNGAPMLVQ